MYFWWIALKDIKLYVRDRRALLLTIAMPLILIAILGAAFSNMFIDSDDQTFSPFDVGIVNLDQGSLSKSLADDLLGKQLKDIIIARYLDESTLKKQINDQEIEIGIIIRDDFSANLLTGIDTKVEILYNKPSPIQIGIIESIISQFGQTVQVNQKVGEQLHGQLIKDPTNQSLSNEQMNQIIAEKMTEHLSIVNQDTPVVSVQGVNSEDKVVNAFQYYAVGMGVMFLLIAVVQGVSAMIEEKEDPVIQRLLLTNMTHSDYLIGKLVGLLFTCGLQMAVIILGTHFIFGVDWGNSWLGVLFIAASYVVGASGLGVLFGSFLQKSRTLANAGMILVQIMSAMGGSMVPLYIFPDWLNQAAMVLPNALALQSFIDLMAGARFTEVLGSGLVLLGTGTLFMLFGWLKLRSEGRIKYA